VPLPLQIQMLHAVTLNSPDGVSLILLAMRPALRLFL
jgi:hypothetical protein